MEPGAILLGKYRVDEVLGTGGMGRVVRATHLYLNQPVAIKILLPHMAESAETVSRFLREAQANVMLRGEHIARVVDVGTMPDGAPFMVMEYLEGNDLNQILRHHGPQLPQIVCDLMLQACEGIAEAHANAIIHRDIKPSNFFITRRSDGSMLLKILDFGISKTPVGATDLTGNHAVIGTPTYMAPEQMKNGKLADARSDIWSIGVVMYQLICGRPPFAGESYAELVLKVGSEAPAPIHVPLPAGLGEVILRCLDRDPAMRPQNVAELARTLAPFATDPTQAAQSAARTTRILQQRGSGGIQTSPLAAGGGRLPAAAPAVPRGWSPPGTSNSSLSHGRGQITHQVRGSRGPMIAGVAFLCVAAGAGGYIASELMRDGDLEVEPTRVVAPPPGTQDPPVTITRPAELPGTQLTVTPPAAVKPAAPGPSAAPAPAAVKPAAVKPAAARPAAAKPAAAKPATSEDTKPGPAKARTEAAAPAKAKPAEAKPAEAKPAKAKPKPKRRPAKRRPRPRPRRDNDLFDTRK